MLPKYIYGIPLAVFLLSCSDGRDSAPNSTRYNEDAAAAAYSGEREHPYRLNVNT